MKHATSLCLIWALLFPVISLQSQTLTEEQQTQLDALTSYLDNVTISASFFEDLEMLDEEDQDWDVTDLEIIPVNAELQARFKVCQDLNEAEVFTNCAFIYWLSVGSFINLYQIVENDNGQIRQIGTVDTSTGKVQVSVFEEPKVLFDFPMSYGDGFTSIYSSMPDTLDTGFQSARAGSYSVIADATGTLQLPNTTLGGILRLKTIDTGTTTNYFNGNMLNTNSSTITSYQYYLPGVPFPLFTQRKTEIDSNDPIYEGEYIAKGLPLGLLEPTTESPWELLTNPIADGMLMLNHSAEKDGPVLLQLFDIKGSMVFERTLTDPRNSPQIEVDVSEVPSGLYMLSIQDRGTVHGFQVVLQ
ncbi:MAG: T9SS type A sorting domain-containing protein [Flavobacteriales bacterium]|nr:T9SS type A sorting domain-containing protein [Flavobacteriales bacterium]